MAATLTMLDLPSLRKCVELAETDGEYRKLLATMICRVAETATAAEVAEIGRLIVVMRERLEK